MTYSLRQGQYLNAMGIQRWVLRELPEQPEETASLSPMPQLSEVGIKPPPSGERAEGERVEIPALPEIAALDWEALQQGVAACQHCSELADTRSQTVFGVGNHQADWLIIGEAPGTEEDQQGEPFVGPAGQLLSAMLAAIGLTRQQVYITNVLKCRTPNNRDPHVDETAACLPYLHRQIALIQPKMIVLLGRVAAQQLLGSNAKLGELRGQVHRYQNNIPMVATYHPDYLLRKPGEKRKVWEDLCLARAQVLSE